MLDPEQVRFDLEEVPDNHLYHRIRLAAREWLADREGPTDAQVEAAAEAYWNEARRMGHIGVPWSSARPTYQNETRAKVRKALVAARMVEGDGE
jgi:hypothetical protein